MEIINGIKTESDLNLDNSDIDGGTIDGCDIGGTTPAAGSFTTITADSIDVDTFLRLSGTPQVVTGPGVVNVATAITHIVTTGSDAFTLADGVEGQIKLVVMKTYGGNGSLIPANSAIYTSYTFDEVGDGVELIFTSGFWVFLGGTATRVE